MGRYYSGDIEGKFWLGVQASDDAEFFGGYASEPSEIDYTFTADDLPVIEKGIKECRATLGDNKAKLDAFFAEGGGGHHGYNDKMIAEALGLPWPHGDHTHELTPHGAVHTIMEWYARLELGEKILASVKERGECAFTAEL